MIREMNPGCENQWARLTECARLHEEPSAALKLHLRSCGQCAERWDAERELTAGLRELRFLSSGLRSSPASTAALMLRFDEVRPSRSAPRWYWGLAAAAALALAIFAGVPRFERFLSNRNPAAIGETNDDATAAQADSESDGFIAVPYAPPLAPGEFVRIVHTELDPAALAAMGVSVDPSWTTQLPADVMESEDGMPRAVRVSESESGGEGGS